MPKAKSTLTLSQIGENGGARWTNMEGAIEKKKVGRFDLKVVGADNLRVGASGSMMYLDGLTYNGSDAHISLTPDGNGDWTYFHFTAVGGNGANAYYALEEKDGDLAVSGSQHTVVDGEKKNVSGAQYFWKNVPADLTADVGAIVTSLVANHWEEGEAV